MSRLLAAYEATFGDLDTPIDSRHYEATIVAQTSFFVNVQVMTTVLRGTCNPFAADPCELLSLDTIKEHIIISYNLAQLVATRHQRGSQQFRFVLGDLQNEEMSFNSAIKKSRIRVPEIPWRRY